MFLDRDITKYIVNEEESILNALRKIEATHGRIVFVVSEKDILSGLATNGDIIRWLIKEEQPDLNQPISELCNKKFLFAYQDDEPEKVEELLERVLFVPIIDQQHHLIAVAGRNTPSEGFYIGDFQLNEESPCFVIAEVGNNHNGSMELAKKLVDESVRAGANCAKFQMRNMEALYQNAGNPDDIKENLGSQYTLDLLSRFQLTNEQLFEVFDYCKEKGIQPLCTPWDVKSLEALEEYGMPAYKVASADLTNHELLRAIAATGKPMICSTGMSTEDEIVQSAQLLRHLGAPHVLLHCNSTYPAPFKDINLKYIERIQEIGNCLVGYSGHERGIAISIAAVSLGAKVVERHITLDKNMEGNDHKASLLPDEFREMVKGIREVEEGLGTNAERKLSQGEMINRVNLAKSLIINQDLKKGEVIKDHMVEVKSPGRGLQPNHREALIGRKAKHDFKAGDFFYPNDIEDDAIERRPYRFTRPWGIPVRYHDFDTLITGTNPDVLEFHLSYKDMDVNLEDFFSEPLDLDYVVHSPELFAGDHTLDLCSLDEEYRAHSIKELQRVIEITKSLKPYFKKATKPLIITNVGGFSQDDFLSEEERKKLYEILLDSLSQLDMEGVEIIPQTMPPFPWHFGGQRYHNLFVSAEEIADFCSQNNYRICMDTSHSKLACTHYNWSFYNFLEKTAAYSAHIHFADSENTGGEGLQIGEGEIDFPAIAEVMNRLCPDASFIPEIWQGHENAGEGFWVALEKLETILK